MAQVPGRADHEINHGRWLSATDTEHTWGWATPAGQLRARRRADMIAQGAGLGPGVRALEIGCGTGLFTAMFAQTGAHIIALDISRDLLEKARQRNLPVDQVEFVTGSVEDIELDGPFDAVIGSSVLHHLDVRAALTRIHGVLAPGGWLCMAEPNLLNPQVFLERTFRRWFPYVSQDETAFVRWRLRGLLASAGFADISIRLFDWLHPATPLPLIPFVQRVGRWLERTPAIREFTGSLLIRCCRPAARD